MAGLQRDPQVEQVETCRILLRSLYIKLPMPQIEIVGIETLRPLAARAVQFCSLDFRLDDRDYAFGDAVLHVEDVLDCAIEIVRPEVRAP